MKHSGGERAMETRTGTETNRCPAPVEQLIDPVAIMAKDVGGGRNATACAGPSFDGAGGPVKGCAKFDIGHPRKRRKT